MSQAGTIGGENVNPREPLTISGDTGIATFVGNNVRIYAGTAGKGAGSTVSFNNSGSTSTFNLTDAFSNTILGDGAGSTSMTGSLNIGMGVNAMVNMTTGNNNVSLGSYSSNHLTTGINNTAVGYNSLYDLKTGRNNIAIGVNAGQNYDGSESYNIDIGNGGESGVSHTTTIGFTSALSGQTRCFIGGIVGVTISGAQTVVIDPLTDQLGVVAGTPITSLTGLSGSKVSGTTSLVVKSPPYADINAGSTFVSNTGNFCSTAGTYTLPASAGLEDGALVAISCMIAAPSSIVIQAVGTQQIYVGNIHTSAAGTATSTDIGDTLMLRFRVSDGFWYTTSIIGNWLLA